MDLLKTAYALAISMKNDRRGVTIIEYGLLAALIGVALVTTITALKTNLATLFTNIGTDI